MTANQKAILRRMDERNIGAFYFNAGRRWIWRCDVRDDLELVRQIADSIHWIVE